MGCDWLHFGGCCVGYAITMESFYRGTPYEFEEFREHEEEYDEEEEEESEDEDDENYNEDGKKSKSIKDKKKAKVEPKKVVIESEADKEAKISVKSGRRLLYAIRKEWQSYLTKFHPKINRKNIPGFQIICPTFLGQYKSIGISDDCYLIWGHELNQKKIPIQNSESREQWRIEYVFPENSHQMYVDFIARFDLCKFKMNLSPTKKEIEESKKNAKKIIRSGIFGSVSRGKFQPCKVQIMGCDWLHYGGCCVGYAIKLESFFKGTSYQFSYFLESYLEDEDEVEEVKERDSYDSDRDEEAKKNKLAKEKGTDDPEETAILAKDGRRLLFALRKEWERYLREFYPEVDRSIIPEFQIICPTFLGQYESRGIANDCYLMWGYDIEQRNIPIELSKSAEKWSMKYDFPEKSHKMFVNFIAYFDLLKFKKIASPSKKEIEERKKKAANIIRKGIFGSMSKYGVAL